MFIFQQLPFSTLPLLNEADVDLTHVVGFHVLTLAASTRRTYHSKFKLIFEKQPSIENLLTLLAKHKT